jgi:uncharacterized phage protein (TIGR01671 family)
MREIKFRAYVEHLKWIVPVTDIYFDHQELECDLTSEGDKSIFSFDEVELMQYTGLKDKNGKEIYEGDLIKVNGSEELDLVKYLDGSYYGVNPKYHNTLRYNLDYKTKDIAELIGNIYENPELLGIKR